MVLKQEELDGHYERCTFISGSPNRQFMKQIFGSATLASQESFSALV